MDDPTIIRHLHDLGALESYAADAPAFIGLVRQASAEDGGRGGTAPSPARDRFLLMLDLLSTQPFWAEEYKQFVGQVSFATVEDTVTFGVALAATRRLVGWMSARWRKASCGGHCDHKVS